MKHNYDINLYTVRKSINCINSGNKCCEILAPPQYVYKSKLVVKIKLKIQESILLHHKDGRKKFAKYTVFVKSKIKKFSV